jgi:CHAT domain-containing protein/Tfp pilus assembly protein PilF
MSSLTPMGKMKLVGLTVLAALCACTESRIPLVKVGHPIFRDLAPGATHSYRVAVASGEICKIRADQVGIDVIIRVLPPGVQPYQIDRWSSPASFEDIEVVANSKSEYRVDIVSADKDAEPGKYRLSVIDCRPATAEDRNRNKLQLEAFRHYMIGQQGRDSDNPAERKAALQGYRDALPLFQRAGDSLEEATTITYIGETLRNLGDEPAALASYEQALPLWRALNDADGLAETLHNVGTIHYGRGEFARALAFYDEAIPQWSNAGDIRGAAATQSNIGRVFDSTGQYQNALSAYRNALVLATKSGDKSWQAEVRHNTGMVFLALGAADNAVQEYRAAIDLSRQTHDKWSEGHMLHHLGEALMVKGELDEAERSLNDALQLSIEVGDELGRATTLLHLGYCYHTKGNHEQALLSLQAGLKIRAEKKYRLGESQALFLVGREFLDLGRIAEAKVSMDHALSIARELKDPRSRAQAMDGLAEVCRRQRRFGEALHILDGAIQLVEQLRTQVRQHELRALFVSSVYDYYEAAEEVSMELDEGSPQKKTYERAFGYAERARARSLRDALTGNSLTSNVESTRGRDPDENELHERIQALSERRLLMVSQNAAPDALRFVDQQITEMSTKLSVARADAESRDNVVGLARGTASIGTIQRRLTSAGKAFLEFSLGTHRSHLWVITSAGTSVFPLPARNAIENFASNYLKQINSGVQTKHHPFDEAAGLEFSKAILGPAWQLLQHKAHLTIVPDGVLHRIPFAALPSPDCEQNEGSKTGCDPLLLTHEISYAPSGSVGVLWTNAARTRPPKQRKILMYVDPIYSASDIRLQLSPTQVRACELSRPRGNGDSGGSAGITLRRLLYSQQEAHAVADLVPADQLVTRVGVDANLNSLLLALPGDFDIVHFATHAVADPMLFQGSGIVLSLYDACGNPISGFLPAERLSEIHFTKTRLVVLSACESALGREVRGEGLMGLVYAFQRAGVTSVVATLWTVDDAATAELMKQFYEGLLQRNLGPGAALRYAQMKMLREYPAWSDPRFWASFVYEGNDEVNSVSH